MLRPTILVLAGLASLGAATGCCLCGHRCEEDCNPPAEPVLPVVSRESLEQDLLALAASVRPARTPGEPPPVREYHALPPRLCQCLAAQNAPLADALDGKRKKLEEDQDRACCLCGGKSKKQREFQEAMLLYTALESRDLAAGQTLEWYYQLAAAEATTDLLALSLDQAQKTLAQVESLKNQGLRLPADIEVYRRQVVSVEREQTQNQFDIDKLNSRLRQAMAFDPANCWRFWPDPGVPLGTEDVPDVCAAVQFGLAHRPHLLLLRYVIDHLDKDTLASARTLLGSVSPLLAMASPTCKLLTALAKVFHVQPGGQKEIESVRRQLKEYLRERERSVEAEIRDAAGEVCARRQLTFLARQVAARWESRIAALEKKGGQQMNVSADLAAARLDWYKARGEVVKEFTAWKTAAAKVKQAQGILPAECGYSDHCPCDAPPSPPAVAEGGGVQLPAVLPAVP